jgi:hypothetical protein
LFEASAVTKDNAKAVEILQQSDDAPIANDDQCRRVDKAGDYHR